MTVEEPASFAVPEHDLFTRVVKDFPDRELVARPYRKHQRILVFHLLLERAKIAARPYAVMLDRKEGTHEREMPELGNERLERGIDHLEILGFIFERSDKEEHIKTQNIPVRGQANSF